MPVIMCKQCARGIKYDAEREPDNTPERHSDVGEDCPTVYCE